jgi:hypothetical protein
MKGIAGYLILAAVLALLGGALLVAAGLDRDLATAQERVAAQKYDDVEPTYEAAERYYDYASHVPGIGDGPANDIRTKHATLHYWQKDLKGSPYVYGNVRNVLNPSFIVPAASHSAIAMST